MVIQTRAGLWEKSPDVLPVPSNLLDHAAVSEGTFANASGVIGTSANCTPSTLLPAECGTVFGSGAGETEKVFSGFSDVIGTKGLHQHGLVCNAMGFSPDEAAPEVRRLAELTESRSVERALQNLWVTPQVPEIEVVGTGEARAMLAALEGTFLQQYAGLPTIHLHPVVAAYLAARKAIESQAGKFYTRLGSKVVVGVGYTTLSGATAGTFPMYATGEVAVGFGTWTNRAEMDRTNNDVIAIAERPFIVGIDCGAVLTANTSIWGA